MVVALLVALLPLSLLAATPFDDLTGGVHDANIDAIYNAGSTTGCVPNESYCPTDNVTRQEMISFLTRTAGLDTNPPVANAKTAQIATNAVQLGGQPASFYQPAGQPIASAINAQSAGNAAAVGGYAPSTLVRSAVAVGSPSGLAITGGVFTGYQNVLALAIDAPAAGYVLVTATVQVQHISGSCAGSCQIVGRLRHANSGTASLNVATTVNSANTSDVLAMTYRFPVTPGAQALTIQLLSGDLTTTVRHFLAPQATALFVPFGANGTTP